MSNSKDDELDECICWGTDFSGSSVCGVPCPVHSQKKERVPPYDD